MLITTKENGNVSIELSGADLLTKRDVTLGQLVNNILNTVHKVDEVVSVSEQVVPKKVKRLTQDQAYDIKKLIKGGEELREIARRYGVPLLSIENIQNGVNFKFI
jgi:hypothetical protein